MKLLLVVFTKPLSTFTCCIYQTCHMKLWDHSVMSRAKKKNESTKLLNNLKELSTEEKLRKEIDAKDKKILDLTNKLFELTSLRSMADQLTNKIEESIQELTGMYVICLFSFLFNFFLILFLFIFCQWQVVTSNTILF